MDTQSRDVLQDHHLKNGRSKAPTASSLAKSQLRTPVSQESSDSQEDSDREPEPEPRSRRARRHSKAVKLPRPTQQKFYPALWGEVLDLAKLYFRRYLLLTNAFPDRCDIKDELSDSLAKAMAAHEAEGGGFEHGAFIPLSQNSINKTTGARQAITLDILMICIPWYVYFSASCPPR